MSANENDWPELPPHLQQFALSREESNRLIVMDYLGVPDDIRAMLRLCDAVLVPTPGHVMNTLPTAAARETDFSKWQLHLPTKLVRPVIMPLPASIEGEAHWRAIIAAAADLQGMVNRGEYRL